MLSKSLSTSEKFASLVQRAPEMFEFCHALYPLLVSHTDDFGRLQGDVFTVKHQCYPASPRSLDEFASALSVMHDVELLIWYAVSGKKYLQIPKFEAHQSGLHKRTKSAFPRVPDVSGNVPELPLQLKGTKENLTKENLREEKIQSTVPVLIQHYHDGYLTRFGEKPNITGKKDGQLLKTLVATHGADAVKARIDLLLDSTDEFIANSGRTIGVLSSCWNKLAGPMRPGARAGRPQGCRHGQPCADEAACTKLRLKESRGAA